MSRLSVGVIFGGRSVEHDVSIISAHQLMAVLAARHEVVPIYISREGRWFSSEALNDLSVYRERGWEKAGEEAFISPSTSFRGLYVPGNRFVKPKTIPLDVAVPAVHGTYGEDGTLQGLLELADIPYTCSGVVGSAAGMDKVTMKSAFRAAGIPTVPHFAVDVSDLDRDREAVLDAIERAIPYPTFVKPAHLGSSVGIGRGADRAELVLALDVARSYDRRLLIERSMEGCTEINCSVLGGAGHDPRPSVCEQPVVAEEFHTFSDKYLATSKGASPEGQGMAGSRRLIPAPISDDLTKKVQDNAVRAFRALDASGVARIDSFVDERSGDAWVMEINTVPGSFSFYLWEASGMSFDELAQNLLDIALQTHALKAQLTFSFESGILEAMSGPKSDG